MQKNPSNKLIHEKSPYLLQHAHNPVNWYPWGEEAFEKARNEDKPIFLSIGYSTCHWCHVMERESFEKENLANALNDLFVSIKVDKEERPDIDAVYMRVCQAFTGSGGWPTSIFMTPDQVPFFAGTYFPLPYFMDLLRSIGEKWQTNRDALLDSCDQVLTHINNTSHPKADKGADLAQSAVSYFQRDFDEKYGGFGNAPKFPSPHNLLFLFHYYKHTNERPPLLMAEKTLFQMYQGGIFDHIGYGFSRYSTDKYWLAPHFEKMLYDNALLAVSYLTAFEQTENPFYLSVAEKIFKYIEREMTDQNGGFYSAQDADSEGVEGKYYVFTPDEITDILGADHGKPFCHYFDITTQGNFEGKSIPNLIKQQPPFDTMTHLLAPLYAYRKTRTTLHRDEKILTSWNSLMVWAYATAYRISKDEKHLKASLHAVKFIEEHLTDVAGGDTLYTSITDGKLSVKAFLDDYSFYILSLIELYMATFDEQYLKRALELNDKVAKDYYDSNGGGFYFSGRDNEQLIVRSKETYDGAIPSGNSVMAYNLDRLAKLTKDERLYTLADKQKEFMEGHASRHPSSFSFFLLSTIPTRDIVCVIGDENNISNLKVKTGDIVRLFKQPTIEYPLLDGKTTFYICQNNSCFPPTNTCEILL